DIQPPGAGTIPARSGARPRPSCTGPRRLRIALASAGGIAPLGVRVTTAGEDRGGLDADGASAAQAVPREMMTTKPTSHHLVCQIFAVASLPAMADERTARTGAEIHTENAVCGTPGAREVPMLGFDVSRHAGSWAKAAEERTDRLGGLWIGPRTPAGRAPGGPTAASRPGGQARPGRSAPD